MAATSLPNDFLGLALVVLLLCIRHGFDAAIDGMTYHSAGAGPRLARSP